VYQSKKLSDDYMAHWRILKENKEIEVVLVVNGTSWVGFGWRPRKLTAECRNFPVIKDLDDVKEPSAEPEPTSVSEPPSKSEPTSVSEPHPSGEPASEPESSGEPISESEAEPSSEPQSRISEPIASGSFKTKRVAHAPRSDDEYIVSSSVSYRVSTKVGRNRRAAGKDLLMF
jgi:hypothetical protein